jgi:predicted metal-dependent hydrolase
MPVKGKEEHDREMAEKAAATIPADLERFTLPVRFEPEDRESFAKGVTAFRDGDFYLAHDLWEEVWHAYRPADRKFLQGLIHIAVGSYHVQCRNPRGSFSQLGKAIDKMSPFAPMHWGIDVDDMIKRVKRLRTEAVDSSEIQACLDFVREGL